MKIFIEDFCLAGGGEAGPRELTVNGERQVQSVPALRGGVAGILPRGNRVNTVTFAAVRTHASHAAAEAFLLEHAALLPAGGALGFRCEGAGGGEARYRATASVVASERGSRNGLTTTHHYKIVCGEIAPEAD